ncbi:ATP-binding protein [Oxalobacteraceae bacterium A2-2]
MAFLLFQLNSLRSRLMLLVALAIAPVAIMTVMNGIRTREHAISVAEENLQRLTNLAAANEAQSIEGARQIMRDLAGIPDLLDDNTRCSTLLASVLRQNPDYANFGLIQLNGDVTCSAVPSQKPVNLGDRPHFRRAVHLKRFVAGGYVFGRVIQKHTVNLTYPILGQKGEVRAVLFAAMDLSQLDSYVRDIELPPGSLLLTADSEGRILSRRPDPESGFGKLVWPELRNAMASEPGRAVRITGPDGVERLHRFARVGRNGLSDYTVSIGIPVHNITAEATRSLLLDLGALGLTLALAFLAAWFVGDVLVLRRVKQLSSTADQIAAGELDARSGVAHGKEEISELARSLDAMAEALEAKERQHRASESKLREADRRKDEFLAMLAHELRNPLAPIGAAAQLLQSGRGDPALAERNAAIIVRQVQHMTRLVDDLLDVSRVSRGLITLSRAPLAVCDIVADAVEQAEPLIQSRQHRLEVLQPDTPLQVMGDHKRLVQVLANVLNNAAKYTPAGGHIRLAVSASATEVTLQVSDNGIGMTADMLARVFDLFAQAERGADRSQGGLGLGLALVRALVEAHGGRIQADSAGDQQGSTFTITLPRSAIMPAPPPRPAPPGASRSLRVLVVDDNMDAAQTLQMLLEGVGHQVAVAHTALAGLELAQALSPELCLLDIGLPDLNGNELARGLRRLPASAHATLIALTGYGRKEDREAALDAGFDHYFVKPIEADALMAVIAGLAPRA